MTATATPLIQRLSEMKQRWDDISADLARPEITSDPEALQRYGREQSEIAETVGRYERYLAVERELEDTQTMLADGLDDEMRSFVRDEAKRLDDEREALLAELKELLRPRDPNDERNVIMEIRAGTGGDEAGLFAGELLRMYLRYAETRRWKTRCSTPTRLTSAGSRRSRSRCSGKGAYSRLKFESGVHRVQRVPVTEAGGQIHTSTATVAVMPEAKEVDVRSTGTTCGSTSTARAGTAARA